MSDSKTEFDRLEIQTRPGGGSSYAVWVRHDVTIGGVRQIMLEGPLAPVDAAAKGFPLDAILGGVQAAAIRDAEIARAETLRIEREANELANLVAAGRLAVAELTAERDAARALAEKLQAAVATAEERAAARGMVARMQAVAEAAA